MIQGWNPNRDKAFSSNPMCTDWLWSPPNPPIEWVSGALCMGIKWLGHEADYSPPSTADVKNVWRCMSSPAIWLHTPYRDTFTYVKCYLHIQYIIIIILFINCNWVITRWQWLFYTYTNMGKKRVTRKFKSGGLHERHVVATWKLGNHLSIRL